MLQRKCSCGSAASALTGQCSECAAKDRLGIQPKLKSGQPGDVYEREADRVAAEVTKGIATSIPADGTPAPEESDAIRRPLGPSDLTVGGVPMSRQLREFFEPRFGRDLSQVRLHTGSEAHAHIWRKHLVSEGEERAF